VEIVRVFGCFERIRKDATFVRGDFPTVGATVPVMRVEGEEPLSLDSNDL
jgi:hypothetical protein